MTKKSRQKLKYLENGKSFRVEIKMLSVAKNCLSHESAPLNTTKSAKGEIFMTKKKISWNTK